MSDEITECKVQLQHNLKFKLDRLKIILISMSLKYPLYMEKIAAAHSLLHKQDQDIRGILKT